ncbi:MAG: PilN family type IVB pilus formation outer membrane protein [Alphaproteobacteria bacterium]|nr:PilN family type IVB pilus formation outer membrane protein [Alphaproteobacteria bacterium]
MRMINLLKLIILGAVGVTVACSIAPDMEAEMAQRTKDVLDIKQQATVPNEPVPDDVVRVKDDIWLGDTSTVEFEGQPIPAYLEAKDGVTLVSNRPITLFEIGTMLSKITSIAVRYAPEFTGEGENESRLKVYEDADDNAPKISDFGSLWTTSEKMVVNYKGPLSGLLDEVANRFGIWWKYEKNEVYFYKYITKTFVLHALPTTPSMNLSLSANASSSGESDSGSSSDSSSELTMENNLESIDLWTEIGETVQKMVSNSDGVSLNKSSGTITVTATPTEIRQVSKYINEQNDRLARQIAINVKIMRVSMDDSDNFKFDLAAAFKKGEAGLKGYRNIGMDGPDVVKDPTYSRFGMGLVSGNFDISATLDALSSSGETHVVTTGTVITMNNKPAPIQATTLHSYVKKVSIESTSEGSSTSEAEIDPGTFSTGVMMSVLPRILAHGRLMVFFNLTLAELLDLNEYAVGNAKVQQPIVDTRGFTQEVAMKSGETLVLAGFERAEDQISKSGVGSPDNMFPGGSQSASRKRDLLIIMLTPVVMESPLSPESRMRD